MATKKEDEKTEEREKQYDENHPRPYEEVTETGRHDDDGYAIHPAWCQCNECQK